VTKLNNVVVCFEIRHGRRITVHNNRIEEGLLMVMKVGVYLVRIQNYRLPVEAKVIPIVKQVVIVVVDLAGIVINHLTFFVALHGFWLNLGF
jgi:hypothetical protein